MSDIKNHGGFDEKSDKEEEGTMKTIAFYLPQFHAIPENDKAWGEGFTEWTNVKKAVPIYKGQYQPRVPLNNNYYNLLDSEVMQQQAELAKKYNLYGFCYYHYYFKGGKKLLEKPLERMLNDKKINIPFCLSWANEPWTKRWDGGSSEVIVEQDYGVEDDWERHFQYLLPFFVDERYIKDKDGRCIFVIYKPDEIPRCEEMLILWNKLAEENGLKKIKFLVQFPTEDMVKGNISNLFEGTIEFEPAYTVMDMVGTRKKMIKFLIKNPIEGIKIIANKFKNQIRHTTGWHYPYDLIVKYSLSRKTRSNTYPGAFTDWDNTARRGKDAVYYKGSSPEKFKFYLEKRIEKNKQEYEKEFLFINAWNEWGEGAHLEPDERYKYQYLEALRDTIKN